MKTPIREKESDVRNPQGPDVRSMRAGERPRGLPRRDDLGELVQRGRVRLHSTDGSVIEISNPTREEWRDPEGFYHVKLVASLSDEMKQRHPHPIPEDATTVVYRRELVEPGSKLYSGTVFEIDGTGVQPWQSLVLRSIREVELVVP